MTKRRPKNLPPPTVTCPYCGKAAELLLNTAELHNGQNFGPKWVCRPCVAWVGCFKNSPRHLPLGRLANAELRQAKSEAHDALDTLWKRKAVRDEISDKDARAMAYEWLAGAMKLDSRACHIGKFDVQQCRLVVELCRPYLEKVRRSA